MNSFTLFLIAFPGVAITAVLIPLLAMRCFLAITPRDRKHSEWLLVAAALIEPAGALAQLTANGLSHLRPLKLDLYIYRIDCLFGSPSFALGQLVAAHLWLKILVSVSYGLLPTAILAAFAINLLCGSEKRARCAAWTFLICLFAAVPIYLLCPVCGPAFAFPAFPVLPAIVVAHPIAIAAAPNGVPSVHTAAAILVLLFLWPWRWGRALGGAYLALIVLATLGSGQHYLFDLLMAVPYVCGVLWLALAIEDHRSLARIGGR
jgi:hypothetical protein